MTNFAWAAAFGGIVLAAYFWVKFGRLRNKVKEIQLELVALALKADEHRIELEQKRKAVRKTLHEHHLEGNAEAYLKAMELLDGVMKDEKTH